MPRSARVQVVPRLTVPRFLVVAGGARVSSTPSHAEQVARQASSLLQRAMQLCGNRWEAQDLVQDALERALRFQHHFERGTNLEAWLQHILLMVFLTRRKRQLREGRVLQGFLERPDSAIGLGVSISGALSHPLREALSRLPEPFRATVLLVHVQGFRCAEAAALLDVALGTVLSRLFRAREMLRSSLAPEPGPA
jgi:RNA polymerase sigma-70 factor (ECF subfamily)